MMCGVSVFVCVRDRREEEEDEWMVLSIAAKELAIRYSIVCKKAEHNS